MLSGALSGFEYKENANGNSNNVLHSLNPCVLTLLLLAGNSCFPFIPPPERSTCQFYTARPPPILSPFQQSCQHSLPRWSGRIWAMCLLKSCWPILVLHCLAASATTGVPKPHDKSQPHLTQWVLAPAPADLAGPCLAQLCSSDRCCLCVPSITAASNTGSQSPAALPRGHHPSFGLSQWNPCDTYKPSHFCSQTIIEWR